MISRRRLIGSGIGSDRPRDSVHGLHPPSSPTPHAAPRYLLVDTRFDDALEIARQLGSPAVETIRLQRDVLEPLA